MLSHRRTFDRVILLGAPAVMGILGLVHPVVRVDPVAALSDRASFWLAVHLLQLPLLAFLASAVWLLTSDLSGAAVTVSRAALPVFLVFYGAFDSLVGIGTGIYVQKAARFPGAADAVRAFWVERFGNPWVGAVVVPGVLAWATAVIAAAVALARQGAPRAASIALVASAILFGIDHAPPFGPLGMVAFLGAVIMLLR